MLTWLRIDPHWDLPLLAAIPLSPKGREAQMSPRAVPQRVSAPLSRAAVFLVMTINPDPDSRAAVRSFCADLAGLIRAVDFRDIEARLSCVMGIGSEAWDRLFGEPRPAELHPFREISAGPRHAVSTSGDLLFHIRAKRMDLCFEMAAQIMQRLGGAVSTVDEVHGFRYFDDRDLLGFVDGTENPRGEEVIEVAQIGDEDVAFAGGSYVIVQKYLHDLDGWNALSIETQERVIGRTKVSDIELDDSIKPTSAHNALTTITENGKQLQIVRDNMPFGQVGRGEFGTYFIGYCRTPRVTEQMIENMFVGRPPGNYDRILDFSRAVTGSLFFVPSAAFLDSVSDHPAAMSAASTVAPARSVSQSHRFFAALNCPNPVTWADNIAGFFTASDIAHMKAVTNGRVDLGSYASVKIWAHRIYNVVSTGNMPPPGSGEQPWTHDKVNIFGCWIQQGCPE
jgi:porphyrinogen peroxidase